MSLSATRRSADGRKRCSSRAHHNVAVVAFANKLARIAWAVLRRGERFAVKGMPWRHRHRRIGARCADRPTMFARGDNEMA